MWPNCCVQLELPLYSYLSYLSLVLVLLHAFSFCHPFRFPVIVLVKFDNVTAVLPELGCFRWRQRRMPWTGFHSLPSSFAPSMRHFLWRLRPPSQLWTASATTRTGALPTSPWRQAWDSVSNITMSRGKTGCVDFCSVGFGFGGSGKDCNWQSFSISVNHPVNSLIYEMLEITII